MRISEYITNTWRKFGTNISFVRIREKREGRQRTLEVRNIHGFVSELILCMLYKGQEYRLVVAIIAIDNQGLGIVVVDVLYKRFWVGQYLLEKVDSTMSAAGIVVKWLLGNGHSSRNKSEPLNVKRSLRGIVLGNEGPHKVVDHFEKG